MSIIYCPECELACGEHDAKCPRCGHRLKAGLMERLVDHANAEASRTAPPGSEPPTGGWPDREIGYLWLFGTLVRILGILGIIGGCTVLLDDKTVEGLASLAAALLMVTAGTVVIAISGIWATVEKISRKP